MSTFACTAACTRVDPVVCELDIHEFSGAQKTRLRTRDSIGWGASCEALQTSYKSVSSLTGNI